MEEDRMPKKIFSQELEETRRRGRPRKGWKEEVERDLQVLGVRRWREFVIDREKWKDIFRQAKPTVGCSANGRRRILVCGNKMPTRCNIGFYCRSYCLLNMFRAPRCPSSGAQEYYTVVAPCGISCCGFQVAGLVWS